ncbi:MAG: hypothetical protein HRU19_30765 [Pseudobacteriovorax sp.]|nr:hypothetical protein [Pseudobacteriovorax sp.]
MIQQYYLSIRVIFSLLMLIFSTKRLSAADKEYYFSLGLMRASYQNSDINFRQNRYQRDVRYYQVHAKDDLRLHNFGGYHITELQYDMRFGIDLLDKPHSFELSLTHFTYQADISQSVRKRGLWDGEVVDQVNSFGSDISQWEHSNGLNLLNISWQYAMFEWQMKRIEISLRLRMGGGIGFVNSNNEVFDPSGEKLKYDSKKSLHVGAWNIEQGIGLYSKFWGHYLASLYLTAYYIDVYRIKLIDGEADQKIIAQSYIWALGYQL